MTSILCGVGVALGLCAIVAGLIGLDLPRIPRRAIRFPVRPALLAAGLAGGVVAWLVTGWPVGGLAVAAGVIAGPVLLRPTGVREVIERREALAEWIQRLAGLLAAGAGGIDEAIARSARTTPTVLAEPIMALVARTRRLGTEPALRQLADELNDAEVDAVVASLILRVHAGGTGLVEVLQARAATLRQQVQAQLALEAERQKPRTQMTIVMVIVTVTVLGLLAGSHLLDSYSSAQGQLWMALVAGIWAVAFWWAHHLTRPPRPNRFLVDARPGRRS